MKDLNSINVAKIFMILMAICGILFAGYFNKSHAEKEREKRMQNSPQNKEGKFVNPIEVTIMAPGSIWKYIKKRFFNTRIDPEPNRDLPVIPFQHNDWAELDKQKFYFSWLGHSSVLIALEGKTILVDPVFGERASPFSWFGPKRFHPVPGTVEELPWIDVVLITHDHYDHLEKPTIMQMESKTGLFLVPLGIKELLEKWGIPSEKVVELDWWEHHKVGVLNFTATPAVHFARRWLFDGDERLWCSWSIRGEKRRLYISGDSGYFNGFKEIGEKLGPFDLTLLKIGAYDELWKQIHVTPEEAVQQHQDLRGSMMVPLHWAAFDLAMHPWYEPIERALVAAQKQNVQIMTPMIGRQINFSQLPETNFWWREIMN